MENKVLFIGSACVDVVIWLTRLPKTAEDLHPKRQTMSLGGCACNAVCASIEAGAPSVLAAPVGTGVYGRLVEEELHNRKIPVRIRSTEENGCCYCFVEDGGERTFLSVHGAEYVFRSDAMGAIDAEGPYAYTYICGLEIEEPTGDELIGYLKAHPESTVMYCPGARGTALDEKNAQIFELHPILHVNEVEAVELARRHDPDIRNAFGAARFLRSLTGNAVIVTLGARGAFCIDADGSEASLPGVPAEDVVNTNGAGDCHAGTLLARISLGDPLSEAVAKANLAASKYVEQNR